MIEKEEKKNKLDTIMEISNELKSSHKYPEDEDILITSDLNPNNIKKDLLLFKNELLKDLKKQQAKIFEKTENNVYHKKGKINKIRNIKLSKGNILNIDFKKFKALQNNKKKK